MIVAAGLILAAAVNLAPVLNALTPWATPGGAPAVDNRVTIVDVFAFSCINCKHVTPELKKLHAQYGRGDLQIIGVHTPELPYERVHANLLDAIRDQQLAWPVAFDDSNRIWNAYGVDAWPTQLIFDRHGKLRATYVGEGYDREIEQTVKKLVGEKS